MMKNILKGFLVLLLTSTCFANELKVQLATKNGDQSLIVSGSIQRIANKQVQSSCTFQNKAISTTDRIGKNVFETAPLTAEFSCGGDVAKIGAVHFYATDTNVTGYFIDLEVQDNTGTTLTYHHTVDMGPSSIGPK